MIRGEDFVVGDCSFAAWRIYDGHFLPIYGVAPDMGEYGIGGFYGDAMGDGKVEFFHGFALCKLGGEALVGFVRFCDDKTAGGIFIEAVDNAGALYAANTGEFSPAVVKEGVYESAVRIAGGGVDDDSVGFVQDDDFGILMEYIEGNVLREGDIGCGFGYDDGGEVVGFYRVTGFGG